jgi:hypothetical protein
MFHRPETNPASQDMLVGGVNPSEKYESQLGSLFPTEWKVIKFMFQTTNQHVQPANPAYQLHPLTSSI